MPKLNDTQTILLSVASRRDDLALYPLEGVTAGASATKAIAALIKAHFAECRDEDGVFATLTGLAAIGVDPGREAETPVVVEPPQTAPRTTKSATVLDLLRREQGATLAELIAATGWLPHTTRAALTGLRKKGHAIIRGKRDGVTCYTMAAQ